MSEPLPPPGWEHNDSLEQWEYRRAGRTVATVADELLADMSPDVLREFWRTWLLGPSKANDAVGGRC